MINKITSLFQRIDFWKSRHGRLMALFLCLVFIAIVGLDQATKHHAQAVLLHSDDAGMSVETYVPGSFEVFHLGEKAKSPYVGLRFNYSRNTGAAFSMLADLPSHIRVPFFNGVTLLAVIMIALYLIETPINQYCTRYGLIMILSGAIGNFLDRVQRGYVIDFVDVDWNFFGWYHDFAIFNVADVAINIGVILLIGELLFRRKAKPV